MEITYKDTFVRLIKGDITKQTVDAIVNAANSGLAGGGGVDGAIHAAGGPTLLEQCKAIVAESGPVAPGQCAVTTAGELSAKNVIHVVGPKYVDGLRGEFVTLERAFFEALGAADKLEAKSVAVPAISTGAYSFPLEPAALVAFGSIFRYLRGDKPSGLQEIVVVAHTDEAYAAFEKAFDEVKRTHLGL